MSAQTIRRWALWSKTFGFYTAFPDRAEVLYVSRREAIAARLSGSHYRYKPVRVKLLPEASDLALGGKRGAAARISEEAGGAPA